MKSEEKLDQCYEAVKDQLPFVPKLALILGSGLGDYAEHVTCLLYTSPSPRDKRQSRMPSSA